MRKLYSILAALLLSVSIFAQAPQKMSYQAVIRNNSGQLVTNHDIGMRISILLGSADGIEVYKEIYNPIPQTNANGLVTVEIGNGIASVGTFDVIDWAIGTYFIKTETDPSGGTNYNISSVSQLLSVPYALYAEKSGTPGVKGDKGDQGDPGLDGVDGLTTSVNGVTQVNGVITLTKADIGLGNVDNTSDINKPVSTTTQSALDLKVDKIAGKGLSSEDYTPAEKTKLAAISGTNKGDQELVVSITGDTLYLSKANWLIIPGISAANPPVPSNPITDISGNIYYTITIGTQVWMASNLKTTKYNDGTPISLVTDNVTWEALSTPGYCWYNNDEANHKATFGALYNWYAINTGKLCPTGWHVPSDAEWTALTDPLGWQEAAGGKLKEAGTIHWNTPNTRATNETGFTALPGGRRNYGSFRDIGISGLWWSSTDSIASDGWYRELNTSRGTITRWESYKQSGYSVRCLKN